MIVADGVGGGDRCQRRRESDARHDTASPIYGMPILDVEAQHEPRLRRHRDELFYGDNTRMLFGDARKSLTSLIQQVKMGV
jgi:H+-translocating NAD(P) transhydrogenase subunit beta